MPHLKILFISQYFPPEPGAPSNRAKALVDAMVARGHQVTVICEFPCYPTGVLKKSDKWRLFRRENDKKFQVIRTLVITFARKNNIKRMLYYLSFAFSSFSAAIFLKRRDIVIASSPPIFFAYTAMLVAKMKKSRFVLDIRDLWPDSAKEIEAVSNNLLMNLGSYLEKKIYSNAFKIFTVSIGIKRQIELRGGSGKTEVLYNGSGEHILNWKGEIDALREQLGWSNKIVLMYAGIIGCAQNLVGLLAEIVNIQRDDLLFVFIGEGPQKAQMERQSQVLNLANVQYYSHMPQDEVIKYMYCSDILLVILREMPLFKSAIPSKFFDDMAVGKPIISNVDGELREIMEKNNTGLYFSLNDMGSFQKAVLPLANGHELRTIMGERGRKLVREHFLRCKLADEAIKTLEAD